MMGRVIFSIWNHISTTNDPTLVGNSKNVEDVLQALQEQNTRKWMMERNIQLRDGRILRENDLQDISVVGGSINQTEIWTYGSKSGSTQKFFVKRNQNANVDLSVRFGMELLRSARWTNHTGRHVSRHLSILEHLELIDAGQEGDADLPVGWRLFIVKNRCFSDWKKAIIWGTPFKRMGSTQTVLPSTENVESGISKKNYVLLTNYPWKWML